MSQPKVSIIIPVYNAEAYIERCVKTLFGQTLNDLEYIFIDDCSPDRSIAVMEEVLSRYPERQAQVKIIRHAENKGVSQSRQDGLDAATGEYLIHCDPDDWVELDMYESLYNEAVKNNADMVICDFYENTQYAQHVKQNIPSNHVTDILKLLLSHKLHGACWNKLVKRECFSRYSIVFPREIIRWEDLYVVCNLLLHNLKIKYIPSAYYHYDLYSNVLSIVRKPDRKGVESQIRFCQYFQNVLSSETIDYLYYCKVATKVLMIQSELYQPMDAVELFGEVNDDFIKINKGKHLNLAPRLLYNSILGKNKLLNRIIYDSEKKLLQLKLLIKRCLCIIQQVAYVQNYRL